jgi:hypothetical protein
MALDFPTVLSHASGHARGSLQLKTKYLSILLWLRDAIVGGHTQLVCQVRG